MDIVRVQRWVMSSLTIVTLFLFAAGLALLGVTVEDRGGSRVGLMVLAGIVGIGAVVGIRLINEKRWLTPWLLLGLLPPLAVAYVALWH